MSNKINPPAPALAGLPKCPSGIPGVDQITYGGLPRGRPTLVYGGAGSGKTLFGMEFLVKGAVDYELARDDKIIAVPTLVRKLPPPLRKIIGDRSDTDRVLVGLQLRPLR